MAVRMTCTKLGIAIVGRQSMHSMTYMSTVSLSAIRREGEIQTCIQVFGDAHAISLVRFFAVSLELLSGAVECAVDRKRPDRLPSREPC